ncbi:DMT family transporter [soil metagenome]
MTEHHLDVLTLTPATPAQQRTATGMLILATVCWGCSFTWAKFIGDFANTRLGLAEHDPAGPVLMLGWRFTLAAVAWFLAFPQSRRGWTKLSFQRGVMLGVLMAIGMALQMLGLDRTAPAVSAFLTALTVLFVPLISLARFFRSPSLVMWIGVGLATVGIWMMTGATPTGFGLGELLGVGCAIAFSVYLLAVNAIVPRDNPFRMTGLSMLVAGLLCFAVAFGLIAHAGGRMDWGFVLAAPAWPRLLLLVCFPTVAAFGILTHFQPRIDATRASLLYLFEPVFAAIYDYIENGRMLIPIALAGATLIIVANVLVEVWSRRKTEVADVKIS